VGIPSKRLWRCRLVRRMVAHGLDLRAMPQEAENLSAHHVFCG
jgi:hypothetical protein